LKFTHGGAPLFYQWSSFFTNLRERSGSKVFSFSSPLSLFIILVLCYFLSLSSSSSKLRPRFVSGFCHFTPFSCSPRASRSALFSSPSSSLVQRSSFQSAWQFFLLEIWNLLDHTSNLCALSDFRHSRSPLSGDVGRPPSPFLLLASFNTIATLLFCTCLESSCGQKWRHFFLRMRVQQESPAEGHSPKFRHVAVLSGFELPRSCSPPLFAFAYLFSGFSSLVAFRQK